MNRLTATNPHIVVMSCVECKDGVQRSYSLSYPMVNSDAGRSLSKRPKQKNDCTVRALATALDIAYDEAYELLAGEGRKCASGFHLQRWLNVQPWAEKISFPAVKGQKRMNPATFCHQFPSGRYLCRVSKHFFAVVDGVIHDTFQNRPDRCIYTAWRVEI